MKVVTLECMTTLIREDGVAMTTLFDKDNATMGHAVFPPGTVVPFAAHDADEYSYILSGEVKCKTEDGVVSTMTAGCSGFIPAGQSHSSFNESDADCVLVWMLVGK